MRRMQGVGITCSCFVYVRLGSIRYGQGGGRAGVVAVRELCGAGGRCLHGLS